MRAELVPTYYRAFSASKEGSAHGPATWWPQGSHTAHLAARSHGFQCAASEPGEVLAGGRWPCRLFVVEPCGEVLTVSSVLHIDACTRWRILAEIPAWQALGPNGQDVAALLDQARALTFEQAKQIAATARTLRRAREEEMGPGDGELSVYGAELLAAIMSARDAAITLTRHGALTAAHDAAWAAVTAAAVAADVTVHTRRTWYLARSATMDAARALVVADLLPSEALTALTSEWVTAVG